MRLAVPLAGLVALSGCRQVLGIEDPPPGPGAGGAATSTTGTSGGGAPSSTGAASTGGDSATGSGGSGGATTSGPGGAGGGGGGCASCGDVDCCLSACEDGVCTATTWDLGGRGRRLVDAGDQVAVVVVPEGSAAGLQWVPVDHTGPLPARCENAAGDVSGDGYLAARQGEVFYSTHTPLGDAGAGGSIRRIEPDCGAVNFAQSIEYAGLHARADALLAVMRETGNATPTVQCLPFAGGACPGVTASQAIVDAFALAVSGDDVVWTAIAVEGDLAVTLGDDAPQALVADAKPVDLLITGEGRRWALATSGGAGQVVEAPATPLCAFAIDGALGFDVEAGRVFLPHAEGLVTCNASFDDCRLDARGPAQDVIVTSTAVFYTAGTELVRIQRPLGDHLASLPEIDACP